MSEGTCVSSRRLFTEDKLIQSVKIHIKLIVIPMLTVNENYNEYMYVKTMTLDGPSSRLCFSQTFFAVPALLTEGNKHIPIWPNGSIAVIKRKVTSNIN